MSTNEQPTPNDALTKAIERFESGMETNSDRETIVEAAKRVQELEQQSIAKDKLIEELVKNLYLMVNESVVTPEELTNARLSLSHAAELGFGK